MKTTNNLSINRKTPTEVFGGRIEAAKMNVIRRLAKKERCYSADIIRTALDEYIENHNLMEGK